MDDRVIVDSGPLDGSLLTWQHKHRSKRVWRLDRDSEEPILKCRRTTNLSVNHIDPRIDMILAECGFFGIQRFSNIRIDHSLITALVERWRPETHSFHLPVGEATITLQDVEILLGLPVNGDAVTGHDICDSSDTWAPICHELLGVHLTPQAQKWGNLKLKWLSDQFEIGPDEYASIDVIHHHARARILALIGGMLFPSKTATTVRCSFLLLIRHINQIRNYSWGSATLGYLYRELCNASLDNCGQIAGCLVLLQIWAWERLVVLSPRIGSPIQEPPPIYALPYGARWRACLVHNNTPSHTLRVYRDQLDHLKDGHFIWTPYDLNLVPIQYQQDHDVWRCRVPLISFEIVEWHFPDRVLRQFGMLQGIPEPCDNGGQSLHALTRQGYGTHDWADHHKEYVQLWNTRADEVINGEIGVEHMSYNHAYMIWYRQHTRLLIGNPARRPLTGFDSMGSALEGMIQQVHRMYLRATEFLREGIDNDSESFARDMQNMCRQCLVSVDAVDRLEADPTPLSQRHHAPTETIQEEHPTSMPCSVGADTNVTT